MATSWDLGHVCSACSNGDVTPALLFSAVGASLRAGGALAGPFAYIFINTGRGAAAMGPMGAWRSCDGPQEARRSREGPPR